MVARVGAEMCVKRLRIIEGQVWLCPESDNEVFLPLLITEEMDFAVWGKVLHVIHSLKQGKSNGLRAVRH